LYLSTQDEQRRAAIAKIRKDSVHQHVLSSTVLEVARARHRDSPKGFACFLSHHKHACAAEARLVKQQLETLLDAEVFLGECTHAMIKRGQRAVLTSTLLRMPTPHTQILTTSATFES